MAINKSNRKAKQAPNDIAEDRPVASSQKLTSTDLRNRIIDYISRQSNNTFNHKQVSFAIDARTPAARRAVEAILSTMAFDPTTPK